MTCRFRSTGGSEARRWGWRASVLGCCALVFFGRPWCHGAMVYHVPGYVLLLVAGVVANKVGTDGFCLWKDQLVLPGSCEKRHAWGIQRSNDPSFFGGLALSPCFFSFSSHFLDVPQGIGTAFVHRPHSVPWRFSQIPGTWATLTRALTHCGDNGMLARVCRSKPMEWMGDLAGKSTAPSCRNGSNMMRPVLISFVMFCLCWPSFS